MGVAAFRLELGGAAIALRVGGAGKERVVVPEVTGAAVGSAEAPSLGEAGAMAG